MLRDRKVCDKGMANEIARIAGRPAANNEMKCILIVDDEVDITSTFSMLLESHGYRTMTATDGRQALEMIAVNLPDLVFSDCMMPGMDGLELSRRLRSDAHTAAIPIILTSALPQRLELSGIKHDAFLQKPCRFKDVLATVERLLQKG